MPRKARPPRLWWRPAEPPRAGRRGRPGEWLILDRGRQRRTGCGAGQDREAAQALSDHIAQSHAPAAHGKGRAALVLIADVVSVYLDQIVPGHARPHETAARLGRILDFLGVGATLADVTGGRCRAYLDHRGRREAARRELQDLSAAIHNAHREGMFDERIRVWLPERGTPRERWLTRDEFARFLRAAWRYREVQKGMPTGRHSRRHAARFALVALYTGTRAGKVCAAAFRPEPGRGWIDLAAGIFYRDADGARQSRKRARPIRLPDRLLAHMRRWHANGQRYVVEFNGRPVKTVKRAFRRIAQDAGLGDDVTPHTLRHTAATWAMQAAASTWDTARYIDMTLDTLERRYAHHHPDHTVSAARAIVSGRVATKRQRNARTEPEQGETRSA